MPNVKRVQEMAKGSHSYDGWRLRTLTEEKQHTAKAELAKHVEAIELAGETLDKGDVAGAEALLGEVAKRLGKTIEGLK